jgi:LemA protein
MKKTLIIVLIVVVLIGSYAFTTYNNLVTLSVSADTQWKQVEADYQRRFDLIPNLVESAKGVMKQEKEVFGMLAEARTKYAGATTPDAKAAAAGQVETALGRLIAVVENYPQLKSSDTVQTLMSQLEGTENRISVQRMKYNDTVKEYNLKVMKVPSSLFASLFGFTQKSYFEATKGSENAPAVKF